MAFHPHVLEVRDHLRQSEDGRITIMHTLTEPKISEYTGYYEEMWDSIFRAEQENNDDLDNRWVLNFLDAVADASNFPAYALISGTGRRDLIKEIHRHTKALEKIYTNQNFNQHLISNDGQFFHGFYTYEIVKDGNSERIENKGRPKVSVVDALQFFAERAEDAINESAHRGKAGKNIEAIRFIRILAERNVERYGRPLIAAIRTATLALHGIEYDDSDISNLLHRLKS